MKIGIITYHRAHNFGALLQAIATLHTLKKLGYEGSLIDYWPNYHRKRYTLHKPSLLISLFKPWRYIKYLKTKRNKLSRIDKFNQFIQSYIAPNCTPTTDTYDAILYGSDQIWRKQRELNTFNPIYFASKDIKAKEYIAFSASSDKLPQEEDLDTFRDLLTNFDSISVREKELQDICQKLGFQSQILIDPTFLLNSSEWIKLLNVKKTNETPYALFYIMKQGVFNIDLIKSYCKTRNLKLKILHGYAIDKDNDENISIADPQDFVSLIYNAEFVFTSSFHGLAFAINFHKQFMVSTDFGVERIKNLLNTFGLSDRFVNGKAALTTLPDIDYTKIDHIIDRNKKIALDYLQNHLKK